MPQSPNLSGQRIGTYEIVSRLGKGGMAEVYRARQMLLGGVSREVAIKVIDPPRDEARLTEFSARFSREAQTLIGLSHPYILKAFDYGMHEDSAFLVMELMPGGSLAELVHKGPLPYQQVVKFIDQVGGALDYAHRRGVIHRDLKPLNVLLDESGNAVLTDFGIVKLLDGSTHLTQSQMVVGTPNYMSPELASGTAIDSRSDLYALGVMTFEMLSGRLPFTADTPMQILFKHTYEAPPRLTVFRTDAPPGMDDVLGKAMAKAPADRYQTAEAFAADLRAVVNGRPVAALRAGSAAPKPGSRPSVGTPTEEVPRPNEAYISTYSPSGTPPGGTPPNGSGSGPNRALGGLGALGVFVVLLVVLGGIVLANKTNSATQTATATITTAPTTAPAVAIVPSGVPTQAATRVPTIALTRTIAVTPVLPTSTTAPGATPVPPSNTAIIIIPPSSTPQPTETAKPSATSTNTAKPTATASLTPSLTATDTPTKTPMVVVSATRTVSSLDQAKTLRATQETETATLWTSTPSPTVTPSPTPTVTPNYTATLEANLTLLAATDTQEAYIHQTATATLWTPTSTATPTITFTPINTPAATYMATDTPTVMTTPTETPPPAGAERTDSFGIKQVYVPAGCFMMGSDSSKDSSAKNDEQPQHLVCITKAYWLDEFDVTNAAFDAFAKAGGYSKDSLWSSDGLSWRKSNKVTGPSTKDSGNNDCTKYSSQPNQPRVCVNYYEAEAYARWRGGRLPTEAEWEYAARGPNSSIYPWGDSFDKSKTNTSEGGPGKTTAVDAYPSGKSWVGAYDMAGNVWQWVADWYGETYYSVSPINDPPGPSSGQYRGVLGGSFYLYQFNARSALRYLSSASLRYNDQGFRLVTVAVPGSAVALVTTPVATMASTSAGTAVATVAATAAPTNAVTGTATATVSAAVTQTNCTLTTTAANKILVYSAPGKNYSGIFYLIANQPNQVLGQYTASDKTVWYKISSTKVSQAWVAQDTTIAFSLGNCNNLPIVTPPPLATPTVLATQTPTVRFVLGQTVTIICDPDHPDFVGKRTVIAAINPDNSIFGESWPNGDVSGNVPPNCYK